MRLLRVKEVCQVTGLQRSSLYAAMDEGDFPTQVKIGRRSVAWKSTEIEAWVETRRSTSGDKLGSQ